jgi:hypothetical protein
MVAGKGRFAFSVAGVLVATLLLSFVLALYRGWNERLTAYIDQTDADLWLVQRGAESFFSPSVVNQRNLDIVKAIDGVERSGALVGKTLRMHHGNGASSQCANCHRCPSHPRWPQRSTAPHSPPLCAGFRRRCRENPTPRTLSSC